MNFDVVPIVDLSSLFYILKMDPDHIYNVSLFKHTTVRIIYLIEVLEYI